MSPFTLLSVTISLFPYEGLKAANPCLYLLSSGTVNDTNSRVWQIKVDCVHVQNLKSNSILVIQIIYSFDRSHITNYRLKGLWTFYGTTWLFSSLPVICFCPLYLNPCGSLSALTLTWSDLGVAICQSYSDSPHPGSCIYPCMWLVQGSSQTWDVRLQILHAGWMDFLHPLLDWSAGYPIIKTIKWFICFLEYI